MSTLITTQHISNLRKCSKFSVKAHSNTMDDNTLKSRTNGAFKIEYTTDTSEVTVTTHGVPFEINYQILINGQPLKGITESIVEVTFNGPDCQFLAWLLKPSDALAIDVVIDNILPVVFVEVTLNVYRGGAFCCKVQLPTVFCQKLGDVLTYEHR